jgi:hypothetical protein
MFNPNDFYNYWDKKPQTDKECLKLFTKELEWSDMVLVNLNGSDQSVGTGIEVAWAHKSEPPAASIIGFYDPEVGGVYPWLEELCDRVYVIGEDAASLNDILDDIYMMYVEG